MQGKVETSSPAPSSPTVLQRERKRPLGIVVLAGFAAFGCALCIYFIIMHPLLYTGTFQWVFAFYAVLDFAIALGYLVGWSWGWYLGYVGAIADIGPGILLAIFLVILLFPLLGIGISTLLYLSNENVKKWFKISLAKQIANAIEARLKQSPKSKYEDWYIGITNDCVRRRKEHDDAKEDTKYWLDWKSDSEEDARAVEVQFHERGMRSDSVNGGPDAVFVYIF